MLITREMLRAKGACVSGYREFCEAFPEEKYPQGAEYQDVLDKCAEYGRDGHASWLLNVFGGTNDVKKVDGDLISEKSIFVCGRLEVTGKIECKSCINAGNGIEAGWGIMAGWGIKAGWGIEAGCGIKAGEGIEAGCGIMAGYGIEASWSIEAGESIEAGCDFGIYAGLRFQLSNTDRRTIKAKSEPKNIMCGVFIRW